MGDEETALTRLAPFVAPFEMGERIASGDHAGGAELFVEAGLGRGLWAKFPPEFRRDVIESAPTHIDDSNDPDHLAFYLAIESPREALRAEAQDAHRPGIHPVSLR